MNNRPLNWFYIYTQCTYIELDGYSLAYLKANTSSLCTLQSTNLSKCTNFTPCVAEHAAVTLWLFPFCTTLICPLHTSDCFSVVASWGRLTHMGREQRLLGLSQSQAMSHGRHCHRLRLAVWDSHLDSQKKGITNICVCVQHQRHTWNTQAHMHTCTGIITECKILE